MRAEAHREGGAESFLAEALRAHLVVAAEMLQGEEAAAGTIQEGAEVGTIPAAPWAGGVLWEIHQLAVPAVPGEGGRGEGGAARAHAADHLHRRTGGTSRPRPRFLHPSVQPAVRFRVLPRAVVEIRASPTSFFRSPSPRRTSS